MEITSMLEALTMDGALSKIYAPVVASALNVTTVGAVCITPKLCSTTSTLGGVSTPFKIIALEDYGLPFNFPFFLLLSFCFSPSSFIDLFLGIKVLTQLLNHRIITESSHLTHQS